MRDKMQACQIKYRQHHEPKLAETHCTTDLNSNLAYTYAKLWITKREYK